MTSFDRPKMAVTYGADPTVSDNGGLKYAKVLSNELHQTSADSPQPRDNSHRQRDHHMERGTGRRRRFIRLASASRQAHVSLV